jgi:hypothetical protein
MKQLVFLVNFVNQNLTSERLSVFKSSLKADEKKLFECILTNTYSSDSDLSNKVFEVKSSNSRYRKIKQDLTDYLFDLILEINPKIKGSKDEYKNIITANKSSLISNIVYNLGHVHLIIPIIEKKLKISLKSYSHNSTIILSNLLMSHYGFVNYEKSKFEHYKKITLNAIENFKNESLSVVYYTNAQAHFSKNKLVDKQKFIPEILEYIQELKPYVNVTESLVFHRNYYTMVMMIDHVNKEYESVIKTCDILLNYISNWPVKSFAIRKSIIRHKIEHLIYLKKYQEAILILLELIQEENEGSLGWFNSNRYLILCKIYLKELQEAYEILNLLIFSNYYKTYKTNVTYLLGFINLYLNIYVKMNLIKKQSSENYEVKKFLKEFPNAAKEKSAMNIPLIIAQLFEAIIANNHDEVLNRIDALKKYSSRYITKNNNTRSNCFINILIEVVKQDYHPKAIERHAKRYIDKLKTISQEDSNEAAEVEFIPYEYQLELLMTYLNNRRKNKKQNK